MKDHWQFKDIPPLSSTLHFKCKKTLMASSSHYHYHNDDDDEDYVNDYVEDYVNDYVQNFDEEPKERKQRIYMERHREDGHQMLWNDYFCETPTYNVQLFRRRFRMNKLLFLRIVNRLTTNIPYFQLGKDCTGRSSLTPLQKCTAAIRQLAHEDLQRLLYIGEQRGFPGMVGSIDCMHWEWKNCPTAWKGMYSRGTEKPTIVLEAVASSDLWIWHAFFGAPGTMNDFNILDQSPVFDDIINGIAPQVNFCVNGNPYHLAYYLTDGICPKWATFIQSIRLPQSEKHSLFAKTQEAVRKDVERAFGVLQARFAVVKNPSKLWDKEKIANIMKACIILHNMIVEDERSTFTQYN
ncbi:PREDICTED: uncharacterized protein LOC106328737 [Brassica oleracea var. oleracea]|uniref:uncharacterized protein LOC106328737 n=1 Tax=Brassica oleracea var. oleracea TaxID=109376 RepID=UPI0006A72AB0|nr:PREDICTED: uncharacterized protein LOC106328737 [Brassica oleracea var. oleracea]